MADKAYQIAFNDAPADDGLYGDVVSLTVEENTAMASAMHLCLTTRLGDDGAWVYLDDGRFDLFTKVSVKVGFSGGGGLAESLSGLGAGGNEGLDPVFDGYITAVHANLGAETGTSQIDVHALDTSVLMSLEEKVVRWTNLSDSDIANQILAAYGVRVQADNTATTHQENDTAILQRASDAQFVRQLAERNGFEFYFETDKQDGGVVAYFRPPQLDGTPQPDLALQFGEQSNLKSFSARLSGQRPLNVKTVQIDVKANSANIGQAGDVQLAKLGDRDSNTLIGGPLGSLVTPRDAPAQMLVLGAPTSDPTELDIIAQAVRDEAGWIVEAKGEINSDAYQKVLRPHRLVLVKGAGAPYSGKYYVTRVVHELKGDGTYTQSFEARRNARGVDGSEQFGGSGLGLSLPGL